ncbi:MAG: hypothetical protein JXQ96_09205 [Cyclobacteriaceae bacterium]
MNTKAKIVMGILVLTTTFFIVSANIQANEAKKQYARAENAEKNISKMATIAEQKSVEAIEAQDRAFRAEKELEDCKNSK